MGQVAIQGLHAPTRTLIVELWREIGREVLAAHMHARESMRGPVADEELPKCSDFGEKIADLIKT